MNKKRPAFDPAFISSLNIVDIDEVSYLSLYGGEKTPTAIPKRPAQQRTNYRPLVDVINPQPKAFFAYLRMPKEEPKKSAKTTQRIKRTRKKKAI